MLPTSSAVMLATTFISRRSLALLRKLKLVHVVVERRHLTVFATEQLLQRGTCVGVLLLRHGQLCEQPIELA